MSQQQIITAVLLDENQTLSYMEICQQHQVPEEWLRDLIEQGLLGEVHGSLQRLQFDINMVRRLQSAYRLQYDLGLNTAGVVLALELLDELTALRNELNVLRRHLHD